MGIPPLMAHPSADRLADWSAFDPVSSLAVLTWVAGCALLRCGIPIGSGPHLGARTTSAMVGAGAIA
jgi:hypothetical protein